MFENSYKILKNDKYGITIKLPELLQMQKHSTTFDQSFIVFIEAKNFNEPKEQQIALKKMSKKAKTFIQWCLILDNSVVGSKLERIAFSKVSELAIMFEQLQIVHKKTDPKGFTKRCKKLRSKWHSLALLKMTKIAESFDQWNIIYCLAIADENLELQTIAFNKMKE
jgi:hypothetical protein